MSRGTAPRLTLIALVSAAALYVAVPLAGPANAAEYRIRVTDSAFNPVPIDVEKGDIVVWELHPSAQLTHTVTSEDGLFRAVLVPGSASTEFSYPFNAGGKFTYFCENHFQSNFMVGQVRVAEGPPPPPPPTTTTTTEPRPTTTTTAPRPTTTTTAPPTTTTTRPDPTTTTTRPPATSPPPTTEPPAQASTDRSATTSTTARATTTSGKPSTSTTTKKKPATTTTNTEPPETTTSSTAPALPADWIPTPDIVPGDASTTTTTSPDTEEAASSKPKGGKGGGGGGFPLAGAGILGLLVLGGAGWGWYHRSSRYLPA